MTTVLYPTGIIHF